MVKFASLKQDKVPKDQNGTLNGTLSDTLEGKILTIIRENPKLTQSQIAVLTGRSERSTKRMMKSMMEKGKIERVGGRKYGCWKEKTD